MASKSSILSVKIVGDAKKLNSALGQANNKIGDFAAKTGKFAKIAAATVGAVGVAIAGIAIKGGIDRALAIENAQAKLRGLKMSTQDITAVMDAALASVKGTAFGLGDAASVAAQVTAAGVKPGKDLERTLRLVADAATVAQTGMGDMGAIFGKVAAGGKVTTEVMNQLTDRGISAWQMLATSMGKTVPEIQALVTAGKVSFKDFQKAMEIGVAGAALESGKTTVGAFQNMMAAMSRFGEMLIKGVFPLAVTVFGGINHFLDDMASRAGPAVERFSAAFAAWALPAMEQFAGFIRGVVVPALGVFFTWVGQKLIPALSDFAQSIRGPIVRAVTTLGSAAGGLAPVLGEVIPDAIRTLGTILGAVIDTFTNLAGWIRDNKDLIGALAFAVLSAVTAWKILTTVTAIWGAAKTIIEGVTTAVAAYRAGLSLATAAQAGFNVALSANPVGIVILAVAALAGAIIWVATQTTFFQDAWKAVTDFMGPAIQDASQGVVAAVTWIAITWNNITAGISQAWSAVTSWIQSAIQDASRGVVAAATWMAGIWSRITAGISQAWSAVTAWIQSAAQSAAGGITSALNWVGNTAAGIARAISEAWSSAWRWISDIVAGAVNWIVGVINNIGAAVRGVIGWVQQLFSGFRIPGWLRDVMSFMGVGGTGWDMAGGHIPPGADGTGATGFLLAPTRAGTPTSTTTPTINNITVTIKTGVGDPVAIGEEVNRVLTKWKRSTGREVAA